MNEQLSDHAQKNELLAALMDAQRERTALQARVRELEGALRGAVEALDAVIDTACHPAIAVRSVMVPLGPVREAVGAAKAVLANGGAQ